MDPTTITCIWGLYGLVRGIMANNEREAKETQIKEQLVNKYPEAAKANQERVDEQIRQEELKELARLQAKYH